ncbi:putative negative regulator of RcsB-dependent stress response [Chromohalobacter marismortui]|uniref:Ancillary SecYEG translocon subunit n=1 Tax=Chromohalobacter marismortui TaxID=42055 RepID=A0A4R7NFF3_9GAMM|nr:MULTISPECIES: tetratricopeptide repeat protein [Chromohalobacter]MCI0509383.1 tetratricopeptide repeat protein [Chromohalobacter sp.]MCI0593004.1 tetratricopeptide repeat protein [Chromohalobacter sp.]TDU19255.1 putative negative regulator of RcsB-dependent stress response [Chromohalobacter marismortui]
MAELITSEEEQLETLKRWWKEYGKAVIAGIVLAGAGIFAWYAWQDYQVSQATAASQRYQQLTLLMQQPQMNAEQRQQATSMIEGLKSEHGGTLYAELAELMRARLAVDANHLESARDTLSAFIDGSEHAYLDGLARLNLARVQIALDNAEGALTTLGNDIPASLDAQVANTRGDAYVALDQPDQARQAYQDALALAKEQDLPLFGVQLKLDNLGVKDAS